MKQRTKTKRRKKKEFMGRCTKKNELVIGKNVEQTRTHTRNHADPLLNFAIMSW